MVVGGIVGVLILLVLVAIVLLVTAGCSGMWGVGVCCGSYLYSFQPVRNFTQRHHHSTPALAATRHVRTSTLTSIVGYCLQVHCACMTLFKVVVNVIARTCRVPVIAD